MKFDPVLKPEQATHLRYVVRQLVRAEIAASWKGSAHVEDIKIIEDELKAARIRFSLAVTTMTVKESK